MYTVYKHQNKINGKIYIGITMQEPEKRWGNNGINYKTSPHFYAAIEKYGWNNFDHDILFENLTHDEACSKEQELIEYYNSMNREFGYNSTSGGDVFIMNEETKQKISHSMMGNTNGFGHPCSDEKKRKLANHKRVALSQKNINRNYLLLQNNDMSHVLKKRRKNSLKIIQTKEKSIARSWILYMNPFKSAADNSVFQQQILQNSAMAEARL